jgi:hypothetical protein
METPHDRDEYPVGLLPCQSQIMGEGGGASDELVTAVTTAP